MRAQIKGYNTLCMIQRIQTVFLLLAIICLGLFLHFPLITTEGSNVSEYHGIDVALRYNGYIYYINLIFVATAAALTLVTMLLPLLYDKERGVAYLIARALVPGFGWAAFFIVKKDATPVSSSTIRKAQMLLCWLSIMFIGCAFAFVYYRYMTKIFPGDVVLTYYNLLALAAVVFEVLAYVYIRKDENLIKSLDRLR